MRIGTPKFEKEEAARLKRMPISKLKPYGLVRFPLYVFMRLNKKFIAVKTPLDFFTEKDFEKLKAFNDFYFTAFADQLLPFESAGQSLKAILSWRLPATGGGGKKFPERPLAPATYEMSDSILRIIGKVWGAGLVVEPFFVAITVDELCEAIPSEDLLKVRELSVDTYQLALLRSSWAIFVSLHMGLTDLQWLNRLRTTSFQYFGGMVEALPSDLLSREIIKLSAHVIETPDQRLVDGEMFSSRAERLAQRLAPRLERVKNEVIAGSSHVPTIYGSKGFAGVGGV